MSDWECSCGIQWRTRFFNPRKYLDEKMQTRGERERESTRRSWADIEETSEMAQNIRNLNWGLGQMYILPESFKELPKGTTVKYISILDNSIYDIIWFDLLKLKILIASSCTCEINVVSRGTQWMRTEKTLGKGTGFKMYCFVLHIYINEIRTIEVAY